MIEIRLEGVVIAMYKGGITWILQRGSGSGYLVSTSLFLSPQRTPQGSEIGPHQRFAKVNEAWRWLECVIWS